MEEDVSAEVGFDLVEKAERDTMMVDAVEGKRVAAGNDMAMQTTSTSDVKHVMAGTVYQACEEK